MAPLTHEKNSSNFLDLDSSENIKDVLLQNDTQ